MAKEPTQASTPPPTPNTTTTIYVKAARATEVRLESIDRLLGDPRKGVGVAAIGHPPKSGILGPV
jgi:hypothetical protein